jgi:4-hydroxy-3-methylbut-2-enyl diphosphate reductase
MLASETQGIADYLKQIMAQHYANEPTSNHFADTRDTLCYATNDNQSAVKGMLATHADMALVVGGYNSSNTTHLVELCETVLPTYFINHENCLLPGFAIKHFDLHQHAEVTSNYIPPECRPFRVMITSGASCPDALVERVIDRLAELTGNTPELKALKSKWASE